MNSFFQNIDESEYQKLKKAVPLITVLIAGADGKFSKDEMEWAEKITRIRSYKMDDELLDFYKDVGKTYTRDLEDILNSYPAGVKERTKRISEELEELNSIFPKLDDRVAYKTYKSFVSFAKHVAKASGGILGFFSVNKHEASLMNLPMIQPVVYHPEEEE